MICVPYARIGQPSKDKQIKSMAFLPCSFRKKCNTSNAFLIVKIFQRARVLPWKGTLKNVPAFNPCVIGI